MSYPSLTARRDEQVRDAYIHPQFTTDVSKPLNIENIIDNEVQNLSGGELQRTAIVLCLGKPADIYLIDEPSAYLDSEQRLICARVIKRFIMHAKKVFVKAFHPLPPVQGIRFLSFSLSLSPSPFDLLGQNFVRIFLVVHPQCGFIVEHDFIMATYLADKVIVYEGTPGVDCTAGPPEGLLTGDYQIAPDEHQILSTSSPCKID